MNFKLINSPSNRYFFFFFLITMWGIQQITNDVERTVINLANALSSHVEPTSPSEKVFEDENALLWDAAREHLLNSLFFWRNLPNTLATAKLNQTIEKHRQVPEKKILLIYLLQRYNIKYQYFTERKIFFWKIWRKN